MPEHTVVPYEPAITAGISVYSLLPGIYTELSEGTRQIPLTVI